MALSKSSLPLADSGQLTEQDSDPSRWSFATLVACDRKLDMSFPALTLTKQSAGQKASFLNPAATKSGSPK